jgi:hypothetical protein
MRWRVWTAGAVFGTGVLFWALGLTRFEGRYWPPPGAPSLRADFDQQIRNNKALLKAPTHGTVGYRNEFFAHAPNGAELSNYYFLLSRYSFAPLLLDRTGHHPVTLLHAPDGRLLFIREAKRP